MPLGKKAKDYYLGKLGAKLNCAQAVLAAFENDFNINEEVIKHFSKYGRGNAPQGLCGSYHAGKYIIEKFHPEKLKEFELFFVGAAKSLHCKNIRAMKKLSCVGCVEKAEEFLLSLFEQPNQKPYLS